MCDCIEAVNEKLSAAGHNARIDIPITFNSGMNLRKEMVMVSVVKADKSNRKKPIALFASFCPFCGEKY